MQKWLPIPPTILISSFTTEVLGKQKSWVVALCVCEGPDEVQGISPSMRNQSCNGIGNIGLGYARALLLDIVFVRDLGNTLWPSDCVSAMDLRIFSDELVRSKTVAVA